MKTQARCAPDRQRVKIGVVAQRVQQQIPEMVLHQSVPASRPPPACRGKYLASPMTAGLVGAKVFAAIPTGVGNFKQLF
jgi:hypothetical protein